MRRGIVRCSVRSSVRCSVECSVRCSVRCSVDRPFWPVLPRENRRRQRGPSYLVVVVVVGAPHPLRPGARFAVKAVGGALRNDRCQRCSRASLFHRTARPNTTPAPLPAVFPAYPHFPLSATSFTNTHFLIANAYSSTFFNIHAQDFSPSAQHAPEHHWQRSLRASPPFSRRCFLHPPLEIQLSHRTL